MTSSTEKAGVTVWVRHGESEWNRAGLMQGQTSWPALTDLGVRQADSVAQLLADGERPCRIVSSDLRRAAQTAHIVGDRLNLPVEHTVLLRERSWGIFEGRPVADGYRAASGLAEHESLPQAESRRQLADRLRRLRPSLTGPGPVVVVTHGDVIREAVALWAPGQAPGAVPGNGCATRILIPATALH